MTRDNRPDGIGRETLISIVINMAFTAAFFAAIFGFAARVPIGGAHGIAADFVPQSFMVALMGSLVPMLIVRAKLGLRRLGVGRVALRAVVTALAAALLSGGGAFILNSIDGTTSLDPVPALAVKLAYAAILAAIVTPLSLIWLHRRGAVGSQSGNPA